MTRPPVMSRARVRVSPHPCCCTPAALATEAAGLRPSSPALAAPVAERLPAGWFAGAARLLPNDLAPRA
jgi:hypothetical protein